MTFPTQTSIKINSSEQQDPGIRSRDRDPGMSDDTSHLRCHKEFRWDRKKYTPAFLETLIMGNYHDKTAESHVKMISITTPEQIEMVKEKIIAKVTGNSGNQLLQLLLDAPSGLHDLYRISRIIFKEQ